MIDSKDDKDKKQAKTAAGNGMERTAPHEIRPASERYTPPDADEAGGGLPPQSRWRTSALLSQKMTETR